MKYGILPFTELLNKVESIVTEILGIFNNIVNEEKRLIANFQIEYLKNNQTSEVEFASHLINKVQCLEEMINLVKLKMKLLNSVYSCCWYI